MNLSESARPPIHDLDVDMMVSAISVANIPTLLMVLVHLTGDLKWLEAPYSPTRGRGFDDNDDGGLPPSIQEEVRRAACEAIQRWVQDGKVALAEPGPNLLARMLSVAMGEPVPPEYGVMLEADFAAAKEDWPSDRDALVLRSEGSPYSAIVIGAGIAGIAAAKALRKAGISFRLYERNPAVGGVWYENRYPGAGVDTPNHLYSFSGSIHDWEHYFARRDEIEAYLLETVQEADLTDRISLSTTVDRVVYDEVRQGWHVHVRHGDGRAEVAFADVVISAVGAFNLPKSPNINGMNDFPGPVFHTARWPDDFSVDGKRIAVIGTGASAIQVVPAIADRARTVTVFQRSAPWIGPFEKLRMEVPPALRYLLHTVPLYQWWYRERLHWTFNDRLFESFHIDPDWNQPDWSINERNDAFRQFYVKYISEELGDRQDLLEKVIPDYPPFGKRMLLDTGWYRTLTRENVTLIAESATRIEGREVVSESGERFEADAIVLATGFDVVRFLSTYEVVGRHGRSLRDEWGDDDPRAYRGCVVPGYPNFFILYGPNLQPGHGGSIIWTLEAQVTYVTNLLKEMELGGLGSIECRQDVCDAYNDEIDRLLERMVWHHPRVQNYYKNAAGRVVMNSPYRNVDFWHALKSAGLDDYTVEPRRRRSPAAD